MTKQAILTVSFGTTYAQTREKTIGATEKAISQAFPDFDLVRAFTSRIVRRRIAAKEKIDIDDPIVALDKLVDQGYQEVYVVSLHMIPGIEYQRLQQAVKAFRGRFQCLKLTEPLLVTYGDFQKVAAFLTQQAAACGQGEGILWMGHGTSDRAFTTYACLDHMLAGTPSFVGAVESYPHLDDEIKRLRQANIHQVRLQPLMLVAGNHAHNDMAGAGSNSWQNQLAQNGIQAQPVLKGLGEYPAIQQLFVNRLKQILKGGERRAI